MKFIFSLFLLVVSLSTSRLSAQSHVVHGVVSDAVSGEPVVFANCMVAPSGNGGVSNSVGHFVLQSAPSDSVVVVSCVGYLPASVSLVGADSLLTVSLSPVDADIEEVVVRASTPIHEQLRMSKNTVPVAMIEAMPSLTGQPDVLKAITFLPGVSGGKEGSACLYVRGGERGQNLVLLDGIKVYNPSHYFGLISLFNPDVVKHVDVYKGAFPAQYGGRASSVVDVISKDGNSNRFSGHVSLGMLSSSLFVEGPLGSKASFYLAARGSFYDYVPYLSYNDSRDRVLKSDARDPASIKSKGDYSVYPFVDFNGRVVWHTSPASRLSLTVFRDVDFYEGGSIVRMGGGSDPSFVAKQTSEQRIGNTGASIAFSTSLGKAFWRTAVSATDYYNNYEYESVSNEVQTGVVECVSGGARSGIRDVSLNSRVDWAGEGNTFRVGVEAVRYSFRPGAESLSRSLENMSWHTDSVFGAQSRLRSTELSLFASDDVVLSDAWTIEPGLRVSLFLGQGGVRYHSIEPRLASRVILGDRFSLKASYSRMTQFSHTFVNMLDGLETEVWMASTRRLVPEMSDQWALGLFFADERKHHNISLEGFYKKMSGLCYYHPVSVTSLGSVARIENDAFADGEGRAYGFELLAAKDFRKASLSLAYTLSWNDRRFEGLNRGLWFPYNYDRRHDLRFVSLFRFDQRWSIGADFSLASGAPVSLPVAMVQNTNAAPTYYVYDKINNKRLPVSHRLDFNIVRTYLGKRGSKHQIVVGAYNLYARKNVSLMYFSGNDGEISKRAFYSIVPTISYSLTF